MARIGVVLSHPPFTRGGHLVMAESLVDALRAHGHDTELIYTPQNRHGRQTAAYLATWLTDVGESDGLKIDQVISLRFPAYAVRHEQHVCWLMHTMREYYDLWPQVCAGLGRKGRVKEGIRRTLIHAADRRLLSPRRIKRLFALSATVQDRLSTTLGLASDVLHPPLRPRPYRCDGYGDTFFVASRLTALKRVDLLLRALVEPAAHGLRVVIAGDGEQSAELPRLAKWLGVDDRVTFTGRVDEETLLAHYANCRAVVFTPLREDYGFVAAEAFASAKPVITCSDSGGPTEVVVHEENGLVVAPTAAAIAAAMRRVADDAALAERWGTAGLVAASAMTWDRAVERLLVV